MPRVSPLLVLALVGCGAETTRSSPDTSAAPAADAGQVGRDGAAPSPSPDSGAVSPLDAAARADAAAPASDAAATPDAARMVDAAATPDLARSPDLAGPVVDAPALETGTRTLPPPPATWQEHWFEHNQLVKLVDHDDHAAIYFDDDVDRTQSAWLLSYVSRIWQYTKTTYGNDFGMDPRLYSIHHQGRYSGGHPSYYFDASHDNRNVSDCGPGGWAEGGGPHDIVSHEIGHVVESANNGAQGSPGFPLWQDSKWAEIYQYDLYVGLGMQADAQRVFTRFTNTTDGFPRAGTRWFRDWFFPLWRDHGRSQLMPRFFRLMAMHFPKNGRRYSRNLNWGEFVHFMSGAAGTDLKMQATMAFGWPTEWETQWQQARQTFAAVNY
jgi:hypothetical protein